MTSLGHHTQSLPHLRKQVLFLLHPLQLRALRLRELRNCPGPYNSEHSQASNPGLPVTKGHSPQHLAGPSPAPLHYPASHTKPPCASEHTCTFAHTILLLEKCPEDPSPYLNLHSPLQGKKNMLMIAKVHCQEQKARCTTGYVVDMSKNTVSVSTHLLMARTQH